MTSGILVSKGIRVFKNERQATHNIGEDLHQPLSSAGSLGFSAVKTILEFEQGLADRIRE